MFNLNFNKYFKSLLLVYLFAGTMFSQQTSVVPFNDPKTSLLEKSFQDFQSNEFSWQHDTPNSQKISVGKAFFMSLILPGWGESYTGNSGYTKVFFSIEAFSWGMLIANSLRVSWLTDDYQTWAYQHAGITRGTKEDQYWIDIGKYDNIYEYNEQRRRDRYVDAIYEENASNFWQWDSRSNRFKYDALRIEARELENNEVYYVGAIVLNHLVSAINALRLAKAHNKKVLDEGWRMGINYNNLNNNYQVSFVKSF